MFNIFLDKLLFPNYAKQNFIKVNLILSDNLLGRTVKLQSWKTGIAMDLTSSLNYFYHHDLTHLKIPFQHIFLLPFFFISLMFATVFIDIFDLQVLTRSKKKENRCNLVFFAIFCCCFFSHFLTTCYYCVKKDCIVLHNLKIVLCYVV